MDVSPDDGAVKPLYELDPGASYEWVLSSQEHPNAGGTRTISATVDLENGRHAFVLTGTLADSTPNQTETVNDSAGASVEWVTLFEVQQIHD